MKFDMGQAWTDAMALLSGNRQVVLTVAAVFFFLPYVALMLFLPDQMAGLQTAASADPQAAEVAMEQMWTFYADIWWIVLLMGVIQGIGMLGLMALLADRRRPTVAEALTVGAKSFLPYFLAQILQAILFVCAIMLPIVIGAATGSAAVTAVLAILAVVAGAYLFTKFSVLIPVIVLEGVTNPVKALGRSWMLTKGNSVRLFLFYVLLFVVIIVAAIVLGFVFGLLAFVAGPDGATMVGAVVNGLINMIAVTAFLAILAGVHRQLAGETPAGLRETFE